MNKILKHKKEEKRIVRLLYRKGFLKDYKLDDLYWNEYSKLRVKKKKHGRKYRYTVYLPEVHFCTTDYWGESDEHSIVSTSLEEFYWMHTDRDEDGHPISKFPPMTRIQFIKYLKTLPTVVNDNKIRKVLNLRNDF